MINLMKSFVKASADYLPSPIAGMFWQAVDRRWKSPFDRRRIFENWQIYKSLGCPQRVAAGPFKGMIYVTQSSGSALLPKIFGTYELKLAPLIENCCCQAFDTIIDIGAAEGYYGVGMALRNPCTRIICFEPYPPARYLLHKLSRLNGVHNRIQLKSLCTTDSLIQALVGAKSPFILSDCEGAEDELLVPDRVPALRYSSILVEVHEKQRPGVSDRLVRRFESTHDLVRFQSGERLLEDLPTFARGLTRDLALQAMDEWRGGTMHWYFMRPKALHA